MKKNKKKTILLIIEIILGFIMIFSAVMIGLELYEAKKAKDEFASLTELITLEEPVDLKEPGASKDSIILVEQIESDIVTGTTNPATDGLKSNTEPEITRNLSLLFEKNNECVGWIHIPGTAVDYPVMHTPNDPEKYLRRNFYGEKSTAGVPFIDGRCSLDGEHLIFYGHNMRNGTMFADLKHYVDEEYYAKHPVIEFETAAECESYVIFAVVYSPAANEWYDFLSADSPEAFAHRITSIKSQALYDTGLTPEYGRQLITLSTCYNSDEDGRLLVIAYKSEEG